MDRQDDVAAGKVVGIIRLTQIGDCDGGALAPPLVARWSRFASGTLGPDTNLTQRVDMCNGAASGARFQPSRSPAQLAFPTLLESIGSGDSTCVRSSVFYFDETNLCGRPPMSTTRCDPVHGVRHIRRIDCPTAGPARAIHRKARGSVNRINPPPSE